jgi:uncharacterized protein (DUF58 family)
MTAGARSRDRGARAHGPGDLTMTAVVLFALGVYGVAVGSVGGEERAVAIGVFAFTLFAAGLVWPTVTLARIRLAASAPADATAGDEVPIRITIEGRAARLELRVIDPPGRWWRTSVPAAVVVPHVAERRGVCSDVRVQVRTSAPLGVFVRTRQARIRLPEPITVGPRPARAEVGARPVPRTAEVPAEGAHGPTGSDAVRAVRPYVPGDPARLVHWPTSARRGELAVREHDPPTDEGLALVVDLTGPVEAAEAAASRAAGIGRALLARGGRLFVATCEPGGPVAGPVADARALGRRLGRATAGRPAEPPDGWAVERVRAADEVAAP